MELTLSPADRRYHLDMEMPSGILHNLCVSCKFWGQCSEPCPAFENVRSIIEAAEEK